MSELVLYDTSDNQIAPVGPTPLKYAPQAWGPEPFFINGEFAPEGTAWNSAVYATLLADCKATNTCSTTAPATVSSILNVDLTAPFQIDHMVIQADGNDTYQIDGLDEATSTWVSLWSVQPASGSGLRTQTSPTLDPSKTPMVRLLRVYVTAGDGQYSVSELQVLTAQANTAGSYGADADGAEKFACSYDGTVKQTIGIDNGNQILNFTTLPMSFDLDFAEIKITCDAGGFIGTFTDTVQSATNRSCTAGLLAAAAPSSIVNYFQAGYCPAGTTVSASTKGVLSYAQINDIDYVDDSGGMNCGMQDLDQGNPDAAGKLHSWAGGRSDQRAHQQHPRLSQGAQIARAVPARSGVPAPHRRVPYGRRRAAPAGPGARQRERAVGACDEGRKWARQRDTAHRGHVHGGRTHRAGSGDTHRELAPARSGHRRPGAKRIGARGSCRTGAAKRQQAGQRHVQDAAGNVPDHQRANHAGKGAQREERRDGLRDRRRARDHRNAHGVPPRGKNRTPRDQLPDRGRRPGLGLDPRQGAMAMPGSPAAYALEALEKIRPTGRRRP